jgi:hypothetical protein
LASWLYGVALRVAACSRSSASRRRGHERKAAEGATDLGGVECVDDLGPVLHEEVGRLPEKYRAAVLLCYWQGLTHEQAAERLRWPVGTVRSRLSWARQRLRSRLIRRGVAPSAALSIVTPSAPAEAAPAALLECTVQGALQFAAGQAPTGVVSASAWALTEGVIRTMMLAKLKIPAVVLLTVGIAATGVGGLAQQEQPSGAKRRSESSQEELPRSVSPSREANLETQIRRLEEYRRELLARVKKWKDDWLELARKSNIDLAEPPPEKHTNLIAVEQYKRIREEQFKVSMDLIEAEALLNSKQAEMAARAVVLPQNQIEDRFRIDPQIASLLAQIARARRRVSDLVHRTRESDPARVAAQRQLRSLEDQLWELVDWENDELARQLRDQATGIPSDEIRELASRITAMKVRKASYDKLLNKIDEHDRQQETDAVKVDFIREDLASLQSMLDAVSKRIEQLRFDARPGRKR